MLTGKSVTKLATVCRLERQRIAANDPLERQRTRGLSAKALKTLAYSVLARPLRKGKRLLKKRLVT